MPNLTNSPFSLALKTAMVTALGLIAYFLLMNSLNLSRILPLRFFNFIILFGGMTFLMSSYYKNQNGNIEYLAGLGLGFITSMLTAVFFATFIYCYLAYFDTAFMQYLASQRVGLTPVTAAFVIVIEGTSSGAIISFALMQYYRARINNLKVAKE